MCGFLGVVALKGTVEDVVPDFDSALQSIFHRGPDDGGVYLSPDKKIILGHRRLCIMDTSKLSAQPFLDKTQNFVLLFNGAIFNFIELRQILQKEGYTFKTTGDTEVVLRAYQHWGTACFNRFNGFFAIAIYDLKKRELVLARDRYGEKPLLLYQNSHYFAFSSELRVFRSLHFPLTMDEKSINLYFKYTYIPEPFSIYKEVTNVTPGTYLIIRDDEIVQQTYYSLPSPKAEYPTWDEAYAKIRELMEDSVRLRLHAEVSVAVFLSGGIDSTLVTYYAFKVKPDLKAFTIGFPDYPYLNETDIALQTARKFGIKHETIHVSSDVLQNNAQEVLDGLDEPYADSSAIAAYSLFRTLRGSYRVVLTGDGGDELFAGYRKHLAWYRAMRFPSVFKPLFQFISQLPLPANRYSYLADFFRKIKKFSELLRHDKNDFYDFLASFHHPDELQDLLVVPDNRQLSFQSCNINHLHDLLKKDFQFLLPSDMLRKIDAMSMYNSIEARSPLLDYRLVDYVFSLPDEWKLDRRNGKKLPRKVFADVLPEHVLKSRKRGFEIPVDLLLTSMLKMDSKIFDPSFVQKQSIFKVSGVEKLKNYIHQKKIKEHAFLIWAYVVFQNWFLKYDGE